MTTRKEIVGAIVAHGNRSPDSTFVVLPRDGPAFIHCVAGTDTLTDLRAVDTTIINDTEGRMLHDGVYPDSPKAYMRGAAFKNVELKFHVIFPQISEFYTTGIVTSKKMMDCSMPIDSRCDYSIMQLAMDAHDDRIIPKDDLWGKTMHLGEVINVLKSAGKLNGFIGVFCRAANPRECVPAFSTVKIDEKIYHESFLDKLDFIEELGKERKFAQLTSPCPNISSIKYSVTIAQMSRIMRMSLANNNTVSSFMFHAVIEIYHAHIVPKECVLEAMDLMFGVLVPALRNMKSDNVRIHVDTPNIGRLIKGLDYVITKWFLRLDLVKMHRKTVWECLETAMAKYAVAFDAIVEIANLIVSGCEISKKLYDDAMAVIERSGY